MPITETQLAEQIEAAFDAEADQVVNPAEARKRVAQKIAAAVAQFTVGRTTTVTGTSDTGGAITGTGTIN